MGAAERVFLDGAFRPLPATLGGRLRLLRPLARGGMAELFVAELLGASGFTRRVVAKRVRPDLHGRGRTAEMFVREAHGLAALQHEHVVGVVDFIDAEGGPWLIMEEVDGPSVRQLLSQRRRLPPDVVARIGADTALALEALHGARGDDGQPLGLVHRDLSPDNLAVTSRGVVKLLDFGIVKGTSSPSLTTVGALKGKLPYMAPEQLAVGDVDSRTDLWALGVTLYELLTGVRPFTAASELLLMHAILHEVPAPPASLVDVPPTLADLVVWLLEKDPGARPARAGLVADLLDRDRGRRGPLRALVAPTGIGAGRVATASLSAAAPLPSSTAPGANGRDDRIGDDGEDDDDLDRTLARARPARGTRTATGVVARAPSSAQPGWWSLVGSLVDDDVVEVDEESGVVSRVKVLPLVDEPTRTAIAPRPANPQPPAPARSPSPPTPVSSPSSPPVTAPATRSSSRSRARLIAVAALALPAGAIIAVMAGRTTTTTTTAPETTPPLRAPVATAPQPSPPPAVATGVVPPADTAAPDAPAPSPTPTTPTPTTSPPAPPPTTTARSVRSPRTGRLTVLAVPFAEVYVDGRKVGVTPIDDLKVEAGRRRLRLVGPGGELKREVVVAAGESQTVRVAMP